MRYIFLFLVTSFNLLVCPNVFGQVEQDSSLVADSVEVHSVKKAVIFSAVLPGAGQIYNHIAMPKGQKKAFWKVPLIYAGLGVTTYFALQNNSVQKGLKEEYTNRTKYGIYGSDYLSYDDQGLITLYNQKLNRRDLFFMGLGLVYLIQVADAAVEAHFVSFDVSKDLTLNIRPKLIPQGNLATIGVGLSFNFR